MVWEDGGVAELCVKDGVCVCDKDVYERWWCDRVVCERWCVTTM